MVYRWFLDVYRGPKVSIRILMWINFVMYFAIMLHKQSEKNEVWKKN